MTLDPIAAQLAVAAARATAGSARPDAPVVPDKPARPRTTTTAARTRFAAHLHTLARWVEPAPRRAPQAH